MRQDFIPIRLSKLDPAVLGWGLKWAGVRLESDTSFNEQLRSLAASLPPSTDDVESGQFPG